MLFRSMAKTHYGIRCMVLPYVTAGSQNPGQRGLDFCIHYRYETDVYKRQANNQAITNILKDFKAETTNDTAHHRLSNRWLPELDTLGLSLIHI